MANWQLIEYTSLTLKKLLEDHIAATNSTANIAVEIATPQGFKDLLANPQRPTITLFLYRALVNPELRNSPQRRLPDQSLARAPLPLELCYMITPWAVRGGTMNVTDEAATREELGMLGIVIQCFHDHAEVGRAELFGDENVPGWRPTDTMQIVMETLPVEDHYRIWDVGELVYRLSVTYRARVFGLDSTQREPGVPVIDASFALSRKRDLG